MDNWSAATGFNGAVGFGLVKAAAPFASVAGLIVALPAATGAAESAINELVEVEAAAAGLVMPGTAVTAAAAVAATGGGT